MSFGEQIFSAFFPLIRGLFRKNEIPLWTNCHIMTGSALLITAVFFVLLVAGAISILLTYRQTNRVLEENSQLAQTLHTLREESEEQLKTVSELKERLLGNDRVTEPKEESESLRKNIDDIKTMTDEELWAWMDMQLTESHIFTNPDLNLRGMAQRLGLTQKKIKQLLKDSQRFDRLYDYLTEKRVLYSCELIKQNPQWSMEAIGKEAGFVSRSTFQTEFKKRIAVTPVQYRPCCVESSQ